MPNEMVLRPQTFDQLKIFADMAAKSSLVPKDYVGRPENIMLAVQMGSEIGLAPMQALQNIAVINGRPAVWGDAMLALVKCHPEFESIQESIEGDGDKRVAVCTVIRRGQPPVVCRFSVADAKAAGLWTKGGPWQQYPARMLQMRARGFAIRDSFPDALKGLISVEEAADIPQHTERASGRIIDAASDAVEESAPAPELPQPKKTVAQWLDDLEAAIDAAEEPSLVSEILDRQDVVKATTALKGDAHTRLMAIIAKAQAREFGDGGVGAEA